MSEASIVNHSDFEKLLLKPEGFVIDFKRGQYCLDTQENKASCIKDIISMANTIREGSAYIVMGIEDKDGTRIKYKHGNTDLAYQYGITELLDDNYFQSLVKDKVNPKPKFLSYIYTDEQSNKFGIIEIFIIKGIKLFRPVKNYGGKKLEANVLYHRRGSSNEPASADEEERIYRWFNEIENPPWNEFYSACHNFDDKGRLFILISRPELNLSNEQLALLARINWSLVIDFNPNTEFDGLYAAVANELKERRATHLFKLGDKQVFVPELATYWFAAQGLSDLDKTLVGSSWRDWNRKYSNYLRQSLIEFYEASANRPATIVILWDEPDYIRTLCEAIDNAFEDAANYIFAIEDSSSIAAVIKSFGESFQADVIDITLPQILEGLRKNLSQPKSSKDSEQVWLPSLHGASVSLPIDDLRLIQEDFEIVHLNAAKQQDENQTNNYEFYRGMTVSWFDLDLHLDATREITKSIIKQVQTDLKSRNAYRINFYHEPGAGGTTIARRVAWDLHETYPTFLLKRIRSRGAINRLDAIEKTYMRIRKIYDLTEQSILVVVEASDIGDLDKIDRLYTSVKSDSLPVVFLIVQRNIYKPSTSQFQRRFFLNSTLNENECRRFLELYAAKVPEKRSELEKIMLQGTSNQKTPFYLGLVTYGENFLSLPTYVKRRLEKALDSQQEIIVYLAIVYHYSQKSLSSQIFVPLLEKDNSKFSRNKVIRLEKLIPKTLLDLLLCENDVYWRPLHELIAVEILEQVLSSGFKERRNWTQKLSEWSIKFIEICAKNSRIQSNEILELLTRLFVIKNNQEVMGKEELDD
ncbi:MULTISPECIES: RNA-binding domain-containing protein [Nostoc]|uniref:DNA binding domain-containing protein n=2 Tax=Nostoc TaxID=1177 RepID=A0ABR8IKM9_9NOSO|nr:MULTISPECIES: RNA-binding domain-containing protein [Nostoc]MBD2560513.1 putative DNA binding domain-containing protein [Nostoc linckia FACHB-391]MBD2651060.1 putative DNA binding domain-containing protein [Nostoc foliaceum FACHB-393]